MSSLTPKTGTCSWKHPLSPVLLAGLLVGCAAPTQRFNAGTNDLQPHALQQPLSEDALGSFCSEESVWETVRSDAGCLATRDNMIWVAAALAGSLGVRAAWDDDVRQYTARHAASHEARYGDLHDALDASGQPSIQWGVLVALHEFAELNDDERVAQCSGAAMSSLGLTTAATFAIKGIADTDRPSDGVSGGGYGFPSYHTSSSFAMAAVADQYYGKTVGLPAYGLAALVGWSRIDGRDHDLSDVVFGAALGYAIGKSVSARHLNRDCGVRLLPYIEAPEAVSGLSIETRF